MSASSTARSACLSFSRHGNQKLKRGQKKNWKVKKNRICWEVSVNSPGIRGVQYWSPVMFVIRVCCLFMFKGFCTIYYSCCHSLSLASLKSRLVLPLWYWLTRVVPDRGPLNGCVYVVYWWLSSFSILVICFIRFAQFYMFLFECRCRCWLLMLFSDAFCDVFCLMA